MRTKLPDATAAKIAALRHEPDPKGAQITGSEEKLPKTGVLDQRKRRESD